MQALTGYLLGYVFSFNMLIKILIFDRNQFFGQHFLCFHMTKQD